jgi:glutamine amidotransferase
MSNVCILDYGSGNVKSVLNAFSKVANCKVSNSIEDIASASHLVLPGVGAYKLSMQKISETIPVELLLEQIKNNKPFLGICVGMQVMSEIGVEFESAKGLGIIPGVVSKINSLHFPLPHVGWNNLVEISNHPITQGISDDDDFYFVHSFGYTEIPDKFVIAKTNYGVDFPAIISSGNTIGVQFHPEKSQKSGNRIIENFVGLS